MKVVLQAIGFLTLAASSVGSQAAETPILVVSTEVPTPGAMRPPAGLASALRAVDPDTVRELNACAAEHRMGRGNYAALLDAVRIRNVAGNTLWLLRGAQKPYCSAVYGAHAFTYFLFQEAPGRKYRLLFKNSGDSLAIYLRLTHGVNDIEPEGCWALGCRSARLSFDGRQYRAVRCTVKKFENGREVVLNRRCGSDDGSDIQGSGTDKDLP
jgi:hypothetical protein